MPLRDSLGEFFRKDPENQTTTESSTKIKFETKCREGEIELSELDRSRLKNFHLKASYPGNDEEKREFEINGADYFKNRRFYILGKNTKARRSLTESILLSTDHETREIADIKADIISALNYNETVSVSFIPSTNQLVINLTSLAGNKATIHHGIRSGTHRDTEIGVLFAKAFTQYDASGQTTQIIRSPAEFLPPNCLSFDIFSSRGKPIINAIEGTISQQLIDLLGVLGIDSIDSLKTPSNDGFLLTTLTRMGESLNFPDMAKLSNNHRLLAKWFINSIYSASAHEQWRKVDQKRAYSIALAPSTCGIYSSFDEDGHIFDLYGISQGDRPDQAEEVFQYVEAEMESMEQAGLPRAGIIFENSKTSDYRFIVGSNHPDILRWEENRSLSYGEEGTYEPLYEFDARLKINFSQLSHEIGPSRTYWGFRERIGRTEPVIDMPSIPLILEVVDYRGFALGSKDYKPGDKNKKAIEKSKQLTTSLAAAQYENTSDLNFVIKP